MKRPVGTLLSANTHFAPKFANIIIYSIMFMSLTVNLTAMPPSHKCEYYFSIQTSVGIEAALRFQNILEFRPIGSAMWSRAMFNLTAYLKYKTRTLICGGFRYDKITDNEASIVVLYIKYFFILTKLRTRLLRVLVFCDPEE